MPAIREEAAGIFSLQLFSRRYCADVVRQFQKARLWKAARVSAAGDQAKTVVETKYRSASILCSKLADRVEAEFESRIKAVVEPFISHMWGAEFDGCAGTQLIRYQQGDRYVPHRDSSDDPTDVDCAGRYFTVLCYLNEGFEGGTTRFPGLGYSAIPSPGKALVFPANYLHAAMPVTAGEKYAIVTWICGPVPIRWI